MESNSTKKPTTAVIKQTYLEVILPVNENSWTENVAHDNEIRVGIIDGNAIHAEVLRETSVTILLYYVLKTNRQF